MLTRLLAKGVGPFENLDMDFSDGNGNPHLGPHIIAGVNGSGKSTAMRAIAWCFARAKSLEFPSTIWNHFVRSKDSASQVFLGLPGGGRSCYLAGMAPESDSKNGNAPIPGVQAPFGLWKDVNLPGPGMKRWLSGESVFATDSFKLCVGAYAANLNLQYLKEEKLAQGSEAAFATRQSLGFGGAVRNEVVQRWWLDLFAREALTHDESLRERLHSTRTSLESAARAMLDPTFRLRTATERGLTLMVELHGQLFNLSQIPDGVRTVVGWLADFLRRRDCMPWDPKLAQTRPSILMIDEVDAHLHPRWQRRILPALKKALPDVQIIVTTHSPFVISSCPGARVHVLELDDHGNATARPPQDAPIGSSITATLRDIFGVDSRFDIETEDQLNRWNQLKRREAANTMSEAERDELEALTATLANKSEELSTIVMSPPSLPADFVDALLRG